MAFGSCILEKVLGYGGSSAVFLAQQSASSFAPARKVAVKVFLPRDGMDEHMSRAFYRRFLREAEAVSKLEHANILPIYAYGEQDGLPYIVMPYMPGGTLAEYMAKRGPLSLQEALWYLDQLAAALDYAHEYGCVHCDVKPANILLDSDGYVMLSDFGIARLIRGQADHDQSDLKQPDAMLGTPDYISPEQALGRALDGRSDVYAVGVTLFFVLTRRLPFHADSPIALALQHVHEPPPSLSAFRADITPAIDAVIQRAMAKDPAQRYQSVGELSAAFALAIAVSEKRSIFTYSHSHPRLKTRSIVTRMVLSKEVLLTGPQPLLSIQSAADGRPVVGQRSSVQRWLLMSMALLLVVATAFLTFAFMTQRPLISMHAATATPNVPASDPFLDGLPQNHDYFLDQQNRYHIVNTNTHSNGPTGVAMALYLGHVLQDFQITVHTLEMRTSGADDYQGIVFHVSPNQEHYYLFEISPHMNSYLFSRYDNGVYQSIAHGPLVTAPGKSNTITIEVLGNSFLFTVDGHPLTSQPVKDPHAPLKDGLIGLYLESEGEVAFFNSALYAL
jgi:serine/threonine protein kinase